MAAGAFAHLTALQTPAGSFKPKMADGITQWRDSFGAPLTLAGATGPMSIYSGPNDWSSLPISFAPNPVECSWAGPNIGDLNCTSCTLGYETTSADNTNCTKPEFRPSREWAPDYSLLRLQDTSTASITHSGQADALTANTSLLMTGHTYTIPPPQLEPKAKHFVGYEQSNTEKIHYELDFSRGAEVDLGCGTTVVGDTSEDERIPKNDYTKHPLSMCAKFSRCQLACTRSAPFRRCYRACRIIT